MGRPDFLGLGAKKSATTWLHECLDHHPEVFVPAMKEVHFFCPDDCRRSRGDRGRGWYEEIFPDDEGIAKGEICVDYMYYCESTAPAIASRYPSAKLIFLLRNPVDRAYSDYWMIKRQDPGSPEFESLIDTDNPIIERGFYYRQIDTFLDHFPEDQIKVFFYDDLVNDPEGFIRGVYQFLDVDSDFVPSVVREEIASTRVFASPLGRFAYNAMGRLTKIPVFLALWRYLKEHTSIKGLLSGEEEDERYPPMDPETRERLLSIYEKENQELFNLVGRCIPAWRR